MHSAQGAPLASTAILVGPSWTEPEQAVPAAEYPRRTASAGELPLRFGVASLEHWLDLNA
jgi:hypothetical protein